jgi:NTP pyrophosphatase (non-canonical NTP hydrolase)
MTIKKLEDMVIAFRDERDWKKFHTIKDIALSMFVEAGELSEHFLWKTDQDINKGDLKEISYELSDVLYHILLLGEMLEIDIEKSFIEKMEQNHKKYPVKKVKGRSVKWNKI